MKLIVQPGDGVEPLLKGIRKAKQTIEVVIFRLDLPEIERALMDAASRGVIVHALVAFTNRGGEKHLRKLEADFLAAGVTVARTAGDLLRYHGKMMVIDRKELYVLAFNFTHLDINRSRSFGLMTRNKKLVQEAGKLFDSDNTRQPYAAGYSRFLVSPMNARKELARFVKGAKKELLIWDPKISDRAMLRLLQERIQAGVKVKVIGQVAGGFLAGRHLDRLRLHTRTIIRDRRQAFIGSQSLRRSELDSRREIGLIFRDASSVSTLQKLFRDDWAAAERPAPVVIPELPIAKTAKKLAKVVSKQLPVKSVASRVAKAARGRTGAKVNHREIEKSIRAAVKTSIKQAVKNAANEAVADSAKTPGRDRQEQAS